MHRMVIGSRYRGYRDGSRGSLPRTTVGVKVGVPPVRSETPGVARRTWDHNRVLPRGSAPLDAGPLLLALPPPFAPGPRRPSVSDKAETRATRVPLIAGTALLPPFLYSLEQF